MYDKIKEEIVNAMKEKNTLKVQTLRGVKGEIDLEHINKKVEINDDLVISVLSHQIKTRRESIVEFEKGNREDLINKTQEEIDLLQTYLPKQLSDEEIKAILDEAFIVFAIILSKPKPLVRTQLCLDASTRAITSS